MKERDLMDPRPVTVKLNEDRSAKARWLRNRIGYYETLTGLVGTAFDEFFDKTVESHPHTKAEWDRIEKDLSRHLRVLP